MSSLTIISSLVSVFSEVANSLVLIKEGLSDGFFEEFVEKKPVFFLMSGSIFFILVVAVVCSCC